jgi:hypothetical protein
MVEAPAASTLAAPSIEDAALELSPTDAVVLSETA